jgi:uncharacterized protein YqjF (DUF2071 family)
MPAGERSDACAGSAVVAKSGRRAERRLRSSADVAKIRQASEATPAKTGLGIRRGASRAMPEDVDSDNESETK